MNFSPKQNRAIQTGRMFLSVFAALIVISYIYRLSMPKLWEILLFAAISLLTAIFWSIKGNTPCYLSRKNIKKRIISGLPVLGFALAMNYIILPLETYFSNAGEFFIVFKNYFLYGLSSFVLTFIISLAILVIFCSERVLECSYAAIFAITFAGYIQEMFLNGNMMRMDGNVQNWDTSKIIINVIVWVAILLLFMIGCILKSSRVLVKNVVFYGSLFILAVRIVTLSVVGINADVDDHTYLTSEDSLKVSDKNNVIVFVLDWYDQQIFDNIIAESPEYAEPLRDFTYYDNATCKYGYTEMAIPYLLTGVDWMYDMDKTEYQEYSFTNGTLLSDIKNANYKIDIYTGDSFVDKSVIDYAANCTSDPKQEYDFNNVSGIMTRISKYNNMPFYAKNDYFYTSNDIEALAESENVWNCENDSAYYNMVFNEGLSVDDDENNDGDFKFIHLYGAHGLYNMTEDGESYPEEGGVDLLYGQARGALKIVYEYIRQLKELGLYDDATIIITADHGQNIGVDGANMDLCVNMGFDYPCSPIMFVKQKGETGDEITHNSVAATQTELIETVRNAVTGNSRGKTLSELKESDNASRTMIVRRHDDIPYRGYIINGNVHDWNNWILAPEP